MYCFVTFSPILRISYLLILDRPPRLYSKNGVLETTMSLEASEQSYCVEHNNELSIVSLWARTFNGERVGPELYVNRGDKVIIHLHNNLGDDNSNNEKGDSEKLALLPPSNVFRFPNTTNLHWHGVHASPIHEDNVFDAVRPGKRNLTQLSTLLTLYFKGTKRAYEYHIRSDHSTG